MMIRLKALLLERLWDDNIGAFSKAERGKLRASLRYAYDIHDNAKAWNIKISYDVSAKNVSGQIRALKPLPPAVKEAFEEAGKAGTISKAEMESGRKDSDRQDERLTQLAVRLAKIEGKPKLGSKDEEAVESIFGESDDVLAILHGMLDYLARRKNKTAGKK